MRSKSNIVKLIILVFSLTLAACQQGADKDTVEFNADTGLAAEGTEDFHDLKGGMNPNSKESQAAFEKFVSFTQIERAPAQAAFSSFKPMTLVASLENVTNVLQFAFNSDAHFAKTAGVVLGAGPIAYLITFDNKNIEYTFAEAHNALLIGSLLANSARQFVIAALHNFQIENVGFADCKNATCGATYTNALEGFKKLFFGQNSRFQVTDQKDIEITNAMIESIVRIYFFKIEDKIYQIHNPKYDAEVKQFTFTFSPVDQIGIVPLDGSTGRETPDENGVATQDESKIRSANIDSIENQRSLEYLAGAQSLLKNIGFKFSK